MKFKAVDTLHVSSVKADNLAPGEEFEVADDTGRQLVEKGLATEVGGKAAKTHSTKAEAAPANKMDAAPINKSSFTGKGK